MELQRVGHDWAVSLSIEEIWSLQKTMYNPRMPQVYRNTPFIYPDAILGKRQTMEEENLRVISNHIKLLQVQVYHQGQCVSSLRWDTYRGVMFRNLYHELTLPWHPSMWSVDGVCWIRHRPVQVRWTGMSRCSWHKLHPHPSLEDHALNSWSIEKINQFEKHSSQRGWFWNHHLWMGRWCRVVWMRGCQRVCLGPTISMSSSNFLETPRLSLCPMHWIRNPGVGPSNLF